MCGIVGGVGLEDWPEENLLKSISNRGPDGDGSFRQGSIFLGHTRLSIQDLSNLAAQPMHDKSDNYVLSFNGEIYNHLDVRKKLEERGYEFTSSGDTETLLYAFIEFGSDCLKLFNGIFAFAIYDKRKGELFIARDQFGVKPLYYLFEKGQIFAFSSEIKSFNHLQFDTKIDAKALHNYLTFLWSPGERTAFSSIKKLLPGHFLKINTREIKLDETKYYEAPYQGERLNISESQAIEELDQKLRTAVDRQLLSDVPVGFFLSGGLDSSLLVAIARDLHPEKPFQSFTIDTGTNAESEGFADDLFYARKVADHLSVELNVIEVDSNIVSDFDKMIWHLDEPQADPAPLNVLEIASGAQKRGIKVLIGGTAGDDIFSGYRRHQALTFEKYIKPIPQPIRKLLKGMIQSLPADSAALRRIKKLARDIDKSPDQRMAGLFEWIDREKGLSLFHPNLRTTLVDHFPLDYFYGLSEEIKDENDPLNKMLFWELRSFLVDHNLNYTDKMSMAVGVETRVPYLDTELVDFVCKLPVEFKMKGKETKYILKKVAERYLPKDVIYRPKTGFGAPIRKWITDDLSGFIEDRLLVQNDGNDIFSNAGINKLIVDNKKGKIDGAYNIWSLLAIDSWIRQFLTSK